MEGSHRYSARGRHDWFGRWCPRLILALLGLLCCGAEPTNAPRVLATEYQLKAVFLFNFVQFVEWPASAHATKVSPIVIGIVGENLFGDALDDAVKGEKVGGRSLTVRRFKEGDDLTACHVLFVASSLKGTVGELLRELQGRPVLTVGETPGFAARGGVINFVMANKKVHFEANREAATRQGLTISSKLLALARVVDGKGEVK
jgi:hypothetical protein